MFNDRFERSTPHGEHSNTVVERGFVTSRDAIDESDEAEVSVKPRNGAETDAIVNRPLGQAHGVPAEGDEVYLLRRADGRALIIGVVEPDHDGYTDSLVYEHPHTDTSVTVDENGHVTADVAGTTVSIDETGISVNGGTDAVVTDVETTTDADGHVTSVSVVTDDSIQV